MSFVLKFTILIFLVFTVNTNAFSHIFQKVTIDQLEGEWEYESLPNLIFQYPPEGFLAPGYLTCKDTISDNCVNTLPPFQYKYIVNATEMKFYRDIYAYPGLFII